MHAFELLSELHARGVNLYRTAEGIRYEAPRGALTPDLRAAVAVHKAELLAMLNELPTSANRAKSNEVAAVRLVATMIGDVWLVLDGAALAEHPDILASNLPVFYADELTALAGKSVEELRTIAAVKRNFPGARIVQDAAPML